MNFRDVVAQRDKDLRELASYEVTKGGTKIPLTSSSKEEIEKYLKDVQERFVEFKRLVRTGEFTLSQLETDVLTRFGALSAADIAVANITNREPNIKVDELSVMKN